MLSRKHLFQNITFPEIAKNFLLQTMWLKQRCVSIPNVRLCNQICQPIAFLEKIKMAEHDVKNDRLSDMI